MDEDALLGLDKLELGKKSSYDPNYNPEKLLAIPRQQKRAEIGIVSAELPFFGFDCWNHYEVSWLNEKGKPMIAIAEIIYGCESPNIIESKSMKLYFNSFNNTKFKNIHELRNVIQKDLEKKVHDEVCVNLAALKEMENKPIINSFEGILLDDLDIECDTYHASPHFLWVEATEIVEEVLYSDLLKSNCLVTNQPDWGSVQIKYTGKKINHEGLLKYLISFRNHNEFHEQCIERIFIDIKTYCKPIYLSVYGRYTRRGGIDINPYRSSQKETVSNLNIRVYRQ